MKMLLILLIIPTIMFAQSPFVQVEVDPRNLLMGSDVNDKALDIVFKVGLRSESIEMALGYESFKEINYSSVGYSIGRVFNDEGIINYLILGEVGLIFRDVDWIDQVLHCKLALNPQIDITIFRPKYNFKRCSVKNMAITLRSEAAYRGDLDKMVYSGYLGLKVEL
jgi:hypothetical protein